MILFSRSISKNTRAVFETVAISFGIVFSLLLSPLQVFASDQIKIWNLPAADMNYAFEDDVIVTGTYVLPPDWLGNIYVEQEGVTLHDKFHPTANCTIQPAPEGCYISVLNIGGVTPKEDTFLFNIGPQTDGAHTIQLSFWGGTVCAIKEQLNLVALAHKEPLPYPPSETCPTDKTNFHAAEIYQVRSYTVNRPKNPRLEVTPSGNPALDFSNTPTGGSVVKEFTLANTGQHALNYSLTGLVSPYYCYSPSCSGTLGGGASTNVKIKFAPESAGAYPLPVTFVCTANPDACIAPVVNRNIFGSGVGSAVPPKVKVLADPVEFGSFFLGAPVTKWQDVTIQNIGGGRLEGEITSLPGEYACAGGNCHYSILAGDTQTIRIFFTPISADMNRTDTAFVSDAGIGAVLSLHSSVSDTPMLDACVLPEGAWSCLGMSAPGEYTWNVGTVNVTETRSADVWIRNLGGGKLKGQLTGLPDKDFSFIPDVANYPYSNLTALSGWSHAGKILFSPTSKLAVSALATLSNESPPGGNQVKINLKGQGNDLPIGSFSMTAINFPTTIVGTPRSAVMTIKNTGVGHLMGDVGSAMTFPSVYSCLHTNIPGSTDCSFDIAPGSSVDFTFQFLPLEVKSYNGDTISFLYTDGTSKTIGLNGLGVQPKIQVRAQDKFDVYNVIPTASSIKYEKTYYVGSPLQNQAYNLEISSVGGANTRVHYSIDTSLAPHFVCTGPYCTGTLSVDSGFVSTRMASIEFRPGNDPAGAGVYTERIRVRYDFNDGGTLDRRVGYWAHAFSVISPYLTISPSSYVFPLTIVGNPPPTKVVTVKNIGIGDLDVSVTTFDSIFRCIDPSPCAITGIPPLESRDFTFSFNPASSLPYDTNSTGNPRFTSNANTASIRLQGQGVNSPLMKITPVDITNPDDYSDNLKYLDFDKSNLATAKTKTVRVWNVGKGSLQVSIVFTTGTQFSCQPAGSGCTFSIDEGAYRDVTLRFLPIAVGTQVDYAKFTSTNALNGPLTIEVKGDGIFASIITILGSGKVFPPTLIHKWREQAITIANTGTADFGTGTFTIDGPFSCTASSVGPLTASGKCRYSLNAGEETTITVRFSPIVAGPAGGLVRLSGLSAGNFFVSGIGILPSVKYDYL